MPVLVKVYEVEILRHEKSITIYFFCEMLRPLPPPSKVDRYLTTSADDSARFVASPTAFMDWFRGQTIFRRAAKPRLQMKFASLVRPAADRAPLLCVAGGTGALVRAAATEVKICGGKNSANVP